MPAHSQEEHRTTVSTHLHDDAPGGYHAQPAGAGRPDPTTLRPGSFVYLWPPNEPDGVGARPVLARVERTTADHILGRDLATGVRAQYEVGATYPLGLRWRWELAAPPERPVLPLGEATVLDRAKMDLAERARWLFGEPGSTVRVTAKDGNSYAGVPSCFVVDTDQGKVHWVLIEGPTDAQGPVRYKVRFDDICGVIEGGGR